MLNCGMQIAILYLQARQCWQASELSQAGYLRICRFRPTLFGPQIGNNYQLYRLQLNLIYGRGNKETPDSGL